MGERPCKESFVSIFATQDIKSYASAIDDCSPFCRCQTETVSNYSRGPISDDEYLIRLVIAPQHVKEGKAGKKPKDAVLSHAESIGMSVFRDDAPTEEIMLVAKKLVDSAKKSGNHKAGLFGFLRFRCGDARQYFPPDEDCAVYCVYDTAKKDQPSHGDMFQRVNSFDKNRHDIRRKGLFDIISSTFVPTAEFRDGAFISLAPD